MVVDWDSHINRCIKYTTMDYGFHATYAEKVYQNKLIVKKLLSMGYNATQILNWYMLSEEDCHRTVEEIQEIIDDITTYGITPPTKHTFRIYITKNEIDYIAALMEPRDVKCYMLAMVCYCKMMKIRTKKAVYSSNAKSYIYFLGNGKDNFNKGSCRQKVINARLRLLSMSGVFKIDHDPTHIKTYTGKRGGKKKIINHNVIKAPWIEWKATEGYEMTDLEFQVKDLCDRVFGPDEALCVRCGKAFPISSKTQRCLCDECYKEELKRRRGEKKKKLSFTVKCPQCGQEFVKTPQTKRDICSSCYTKQRKELWASRSQALKKQKNEGK